MKEIIISIISYLGGIFTGHLWDKFKNRTLILKYSVNHLYLGATVDDSIFGSVKVLYNDNPVPNLYMSTIEVINDTNKDIKDIELNIICDERGIILRSYGKNLSSVKELSLTVEYLEKLKEAKDKILLRTRDYYVPVINRGDRITFSLLTSNLKDNAFPYLTLGSDYSGVKVIFAKPTQKLYGEPQNISAILGIVIVALLCIPIIKFIPSKLIAVLITAIISLFAILWGILLRKLCKFIFRLLS